MNRERYIRQTSLKEFGPGAQAKLGASSVIVVGLGGLGIPVAQYLNAMGVGTLGLVEQDLVEIHNLQRQVLYTENDLGSPKIRVAMEFLQQQNPETRILAHDTFLTRRNALEILSGYDLIVDATDNFPTRYLINDACVILKKPFIYGALHGFEGQLSVFNHNGGATYRCLFPEMPPEGLIPDCNLNGVLGVIPGIIGNLQALEAVKVLTGVGEVLSGTLLIYNGLSQSIHKIRIPLKPENLLLEQLHDHYGSQDCSTSLSVTADDLRQVLNQDARIQLVDVRNPEEFSDFHIPQSVNIPLDLIPAKMGDLDRTMPIYVICASGQRSRAAQQQILRSDPDREVYQVEGGIHHYRSLCS